MGLIIAKFRKKTSTYDVLLKLENEINSIEDFQKRTEQAQRKIIFRFILLAVLIYIVLAVILYFLYSSQVSSDHNKLLWSVLPLVVFPLVIWIAKGILTWYYSRKIRKNNKKLITLKEEKKKMLENVMETETYKVAKKILDKFGETNKKAVIPTTPALIKATPRPQVGALSAYSKAGVYDQGLRQRITVQNAIKSRVSFGGAPESPASPPYSMFTPQRRQLALPSTPTNLTLQTPGQVGTPRNMAITPLPRSVLPRDRSVLDKMVDYLVGDGPSNRYALICQQCSSHNGMALKEEFEYISFRCAYCSHFNPSRKKKPSGPKFESPAIKSSSQESSDSEKDSDSDSDTKPIVTEPQDDTESLKPPDECDSEKIVNPEHKDDKETLQPVDEINSEKITNVCPENMEIEEETEHEEEKKASDLTKTDESKAIINDIVENLVETLEASNIKD